MRWLFLLLLLASAIAYGLYDLAGQKIIARLAMPLGLLWLGVLSGTIALLWTRRWWAALSCFTAAGLLTVACSQALASSLMADLESAHPPLALATAGPFEAVFVCGGGTGLRPDGGPQLGSSGDRLLVAVELWRQERASRVVASGSSIPGVDEPRDLAAETKAIWIRLGVLDGAIVTLPGPPNTSGEIATYADLCRQRGWTRVAVVSSAWHLPRIARLCAKQQFTPTLIGADYAGRARDMRLLDWIPSGGGAATMQLAVWEYLGMLVGR